jgi:hypothetical protein
MTDENSFFVLGVIYYTNFSQKTFYYILRKAQTKSSTQVTTGGEKKVIGSGGYNVTNSLTCRNLAIASHA